ncbi:MAG TPA: glycosyltransferase [Chthoniobacterales bacterium]
MKAVKQRVTKTKKIGFLSLPLAGHLNPMTALARKMQSRGNEVVFIGVPDIEPVARAANLEFAPFCEKEFPRGYVAKSWGAVANKQGLDVIRYTCKELMPDLLRASLEHLPAKIEETGVDALVIDSVYLFLEIVPMHLGLPYVQVWNILHFDSSGSTPLSLYGWPHETSPEAQARNVEGLELLSELFGNAIPIAQSYAKRIGLEVDWADPAATVSKLAVITQTPKEFDLPISGLAPQFHYAGPLRDDEGRESIPFPWERLTGEPLIYASLGTLVNGLDKVYRTILEAVSQFPETQLVLSVGKNLDPSELEPFPPNTIVVRSAPQTELLKRAELCITHAGLNTTLESLGEGVPMVAIPIGYEQPGVASRIAYHGVGEFVELENLSTRRLAEQITKVRSNPSYRDKALWFQQIIKETRGLDVAADIVEWAFRVRQRDEPVALAESRS